MFHSARIKITIWYLLIIMVISLSFTFIIFNRVNDELIRFDVARQLREERLNKEYLDLGIQRIIAPTDDDIISQARKRLIVSLGLINTGILIISAIAAYFLAGLTLRPIKEALENQNRFIADASHELRTPLTSLKSSIEVNLRDKLLNLKSAKLLLKENLEEVNKLESITNGLLILSKNKTLNKASNKQFPIKNVIEEATSKLTVLAKQKQITFKTKLSNDQIFGDYDSISKLFVIILENAVKYSGKNTKIKIEVKKKGSMIKTSISDQGIGIKKEDLPHIFDRFYRAEKSRSKNVFEGYGLGLSIAKQIVSDHKGTIAAKSNNKGTTIEIDLPNKEI